MPPRDWLWQIERDFNGPARCLPLFFAPLPRRNSRISAAKATSVADNFLQKQQKRRERRLKKGCEGNPLLGPRVAQPIDPRRRTSLSPCCLSQRRVLRRFSSLLGRARRCG